jgi:predicted RNase H-like HicB family nuclease
LCAEFSGNFRSLLACFRQQIINTYGPTVSFQHHLAIHWDAIILDGEHVMAGVSSYTAIIEREDDVFVALCPELDIASQGRTVEEATDNLKEAVELFLDSADALEIQQRLRQPVFVTHFEITRG